MSMHQPKGGPTLAEQIFTAQVQAGKMASFTLYQGGREDCTTVSLRAAVWLMQSLEGKIESYDQGAEAKGYAVRIEYRYGTHCATLGTWSIYEIDGFLYGMLAYCRRKWRQAERKVRHVQRAAAQAQKGGLAV